MIRHLEELVGYDVTGSDGEMGKVEDLLIDDERWTVRHLVVRTGGFLRRRHLLVSPISIDHVDRDAERLTLSLTKAELEKSPDIDADEPVSRKHEREYYRYFGYPFYWVYAALWGLGDRPGMMAPELWNGPLDDDDPESNKVHLRSVKSCGAITSRAATTLSATSPAS